MKGFGSLLITCDRLETGEVVEFLLDNLPITLNRGKEREVGMRTYSRPRGGSALTFGTKWCALCACHSHCLYPVSWVNVGSGSMVIGFGERS